MKYTKPIILKEGKNYIFVGTAQPDGSIFLESLYAKTDYNDDNYQALTENVLSVRLRLFLINRFQFTEAYYGNSISIQEIGQSQFHRECIG